MKTILAKIFVFASIGLLVYSCNCKDEYTYVPEENKLIYKQNDLIVYKSNLGNIDTFRVEVRELYDDKNSASCGFIVSRTQTIWEEFIYVHFVNMHTGKDFGYLQIKINNKDSYYRLNDKCSLWYDSNFFLDSYTVNNIEYKNVYYDTLFAESCDIKKAYFNIPYGILQYDLKTGEEWILQR